jgi:hypothetical protein
VKTTLAGNQQPPLPLLWKERKWEEDLGGRKIIMARSPIKSFFSSQILDVGQKIRICVLGDIVSI